MRHPTRLAAFSAADDYTLVGTDEPPTGVFTDTTALNGGTYCYIAVATDTGDVRSTALSSSCATASSDPVPPHGGVQINHGAGASYSLSVELELIASDVISPHSDSDFGDRPEPL